MNPGTTPTPRIMGFPGRYIQGPGALDALGGVLAELRLVRPVLLADAVARPAIEAAVQTTLRRQGIEPHWLFFLGECSRDAIATHAAQAEAAGADGIVALGGGKTIDTAKGVSMGKRLPIVIAPTVASNDSPTSRLIVLYDDQHRLVGVDRLPRNPDVVLVDTDVIVRAPVRFFRAGIGDAISKQMESAQCAAAGGLNFHGGRPAHTALMLARRCHQVIVEQGEAALGCVTRGVGGEPVEAVVEATVLLSGLGFESGGLSVSHALLRGFSAVPEMAGSLHGEQVAFGSFVQLLLEQVPEPALLAHRDLLRRLGLPINLAELGLADASDDALQRIAELTLEAPYIGHFTRALDAPALCAALRRADRLGADRSAATSATS